MLTPFIFSEGGATVWRCQGVPEKGSEAGEGSGEQVPWGAAEGAEAVQAGEEEAEGRPYRSLQLPENRV